jgi:pilus assembly protein FimV
VVTKKDKYLAAAQKFLERGILDKALAEFLRAVQEDAKDTRTWLRIAEIHVKRGDNEKATEVYLRTAGLYVEQGFFQRAVAVYKNIIKLSPSYTDAYLKLADIYKQLGLLSDAMQQYDLAAAAFNRIGRSKEALAVLRQIVDLNPDQAIPRIKVAEAAFQGGMVDEAVLEFERAGDLLRAQGRMDEYLRVAERLLTLRPDNVELGKQVARIYVERNNGRFALAKLQIAFKLDPRDSETLDLLARAFEQLGQVDKAVSVLRELAKVFGDTGRANERMGAWKRISVLDPKDADARAALASRASVAYQDPPVARPAPPPPAAERPQRQRGMAITFSEMAVPQFGPAGGPESSPNVVGNPAASTGEREAIAQGLLEPSPVDAAEQVQRIVAEADVFVKYGLVDRAADHLRKVFELEPTHAGARERLAAVLLQLGRNAEAVLELSQLAEQLVRSQPALAAEYARRVLGIDPNSIRAHQVIEAVEAGQMEGAVAEEIEEISSGMIEMDTPEPEAGFDEFANEPTDGESTRIDEDVAMPGTAPRELSSAGAVARRIEPEHTDRTSRADFDEFNTPPSTDGDLPGLDQLSQGGRSLHDESAPELVILDEGGLEQPFEPGPPTQLAHTPVFAPTSAAAAPAPDADASYLALVGDLEQVDFLLEQGLVEEAGSLLIDLEARHRPTAQIDERRVRLRALEKAEGLGAVPAAESGTSSSRAYSSDQGITPKAMVSGGGEMDLAAHRDLGIAYKDMGLFDAAINEFSRLMRDGGQEVFALSMIGECHELKGTLGDAVAFYKKALNRPSISDAEATQLYFQLGCVFQTMGEVNEALYFFEKVLKRDAGFRDVRRRVAQLRGSGGDDGGRPAPPVFDALFEGKTRR